MMSLREYQKPKDGVLADYLPWALVVAPGVVEHKDGSLQQTFSFRGFDLDSSTPEELMSSSSVINNAMKRLGRGFSVFVEAQRNPSLGYPEQRFRIPALQAMNEEQKKLFNAKGRFFKNRYFLTIVYKKPLTNSASLWFLRKDQSVEQENGDEVLLFFQKNIEDFLGLVEPAFTEIFPLNDDETLTYLHSTISSKKHPIKMPEVPLYLDHLLSDEDIEHGLELKLGEYYVKTLTIKAFPSQSFPCMLDHLNDLEFPFRWMSRFICLGHDEAKSYIQKMRRMWYAGRKNVMTIIKEVASQTESSLFESGSLRKSEDADQAVQLLDEDLVSFGYFTTTVSVWHKDKKTAQEQIAKVSTLINRLGFACHLETINALEAWLSSIPGHLYANVRRPLVHTLNLAHMLPLSAIWAGEESNSHLNAPAHFVAHCRGNTAFHCSTNVQDVGHTLVFGPTGSGKSTLLSYMAAQWLKYDNAQVFMFDKGSSSLVTTKAVGGDFFLIGEKSDHHYFQPLRNIDQEAERLWASEWITELLREQGVNPTAEIRIEIWEALEGLAQREKNLRTLSVFKMLIQNEMISKAIEPFTIKGPFGYLFDGNNEDEGNSAWQVFETSNLFDQKTSLLPTLLYLFHKVERRFNGSPTLLILDEAWLFLENSFFAKKIKQWLKELRKQNVYVIFATQSLADVTESSIAVAISESCPTKIFLPNPKASDTLSSQYYRSLGLNERQITIIADAQPKKDYYISSPKGNRLFDLGLGIIAKTLCGSSAPKDHELMKKVEKSASKEGLWQDFMRLKGASL